jgi:hypothetical protein
VSEFTSRLSGACSFCTGVSSPKGNETGRRGSPTQSVEVKNARTAAIMVRCFDIGTALILHVFFSGVLVKEVEIKGWEI